MIIPHPVACAGLGTATDPDFPPPPPGTFAPAVAAAATRALVAGLRPAAARWEAASRPHADEADVYRLLVGCDGEALS